MSELILQHFPISRAALPATWSVCSVGEIAAQIQSGFPSGAHNKAGNGIPHLRPMNVDRLGSIDLSDLKYVAASAGEHRLAQGDVLFNNTNSPELIGKTAVVPFASDWAFSNHMTRICCAPLVDPSFVARMLHFLWMTGYFRHRCVNHVNQASIASKSLAATIPIVVAPLNEQRRIVAKIDELFSELDAGVAALKRVQANLKRYRAAVLKAAVEGRLTEAWRAEHPPAETGAQLLERILQERRRTWEEEQLASFAAAGKQPPKGWQAKYKEPEPPDTTGQPKLPHGWSWATVGQLSAQSEYGTSVKCDYSSDGPPVLRIPNIASGRLRLEDIKFATEELDLDETSALRRGDLLVCRTNGSVSLIGKAALVRQPLDCKYGFASYLLRFRFVEVETTPFWTDLVLASTFGRRFIESHAASSAGQHNISLSLMHGMLIPLPPLDEQAAIVSEVEARLSQIDDSENCCRIQALRSSRLRQAILKQAFEGKLVEQDPNDEPATALLARIQPQGDANSGTVRAKRMARAPSDVFLRRSAVAALAVESLGGEGHFGRTQLNKLLYLAQAYADVDLDLSFTKGPAGPFAEAVHPLEGLAQKKKWFSTVPRKNTDGVNYFPAERLDEACDLARDALGDRLSQFGRLLEAFETLDTDGAERFATLFAVWNDLLLDGTPADDGAIEAGFFAWSSSKKDRFTPKSVREGLAWMRKHDFIPTGRGRKTEPDTKGLELRSQRGRPRKGTEQP